MKKKRAKGRILILSILVIAVIAGVISVKVRNKNADVYTEKSKSGYRPIRDIEQVMFMLPDNLKADEEITKFHEDMEDDTNYLYRIKNQYAAINLEKYMFFCVKTEMSSVGSPKAYFKKLEKKSGLRVMSYDQAATYSDRASKISKSVMDVSCQALLDTEVYQDYVGKLGIVQKGNTVCFLFAGVPTGKDSKNDETTEILEYVTKSFHYIDYTTKINSGIRDMDVDYKKTLQISDKKEVAVGTYGYVNVILKTEKSAPVDMAALVEKVETGDIAESAIREKIEDMKYKELPEPRHGYQWNLATIRMNYIGFDVQEVIPYLDVKVTNEKGDGFEEGKRTYVLTTKETEEEQILQVFYLTPIDCSYFLELGGGEKKLKVPIR